MSQLTAVVEKNLSNEQFGVSELAEEMNMSRSNLLRKVKKETNLSVSQFINQVRLRHAMELLKTTSLNVSEIADRIGFNSPSYFIKCFREHYGYPPGEAAKRLESSAQEVELPSEAPNVETASRPTVGKWLWPLAGVALVAAVVAILFLKKEDTIREKSIAVLPFKNESTDSSNVYLINGLMESTLNNLQQIGELRVISRTSTEKFRRTQKSIPEMADELNVNYFVEGSGQKVNDQILLTIQLVDARSDRHLWSRQYKRKVTDIFELQQEVAKDIASEIKVVLTKEDTQRIEQRPTNNLAAYDCFLKGINLMRNADNAQLREAISWFSQAVEKDPEFGRAYAHMVLAYHLMEAFNAEKKHMDEVDRLSDKAMLHDPRSAESLVAKAISYLHRKQYDKALPYLERAHSYNPNSAVAVSFLTDFYYNYVPDSEKYLEYALKGIRLNAGSQDSINHSYTYIRLSNALLLLGFAEEAHDALDKADALYKENGFTGYLRAFTYLAKDRDVKRTRDILLDIYKKDTTRLDIVQEIAKMNYFLKDYQESYKWFRKFINLRAMWNLDMYKHEEIKIAFVMRQLGYNKEADYYLERYKQYCESDNSVFRNISTSMYYATIEDYPKSLEYLKKYADENHNYFWVLFWDFDPALDEVRKRPEFIQQMRRIEDQFWKHHQELRTSLQEKGLLSSIARSK